MLIAYDQYGISEDDETLIDDCHNYMGTDDSPVAGFTWPWDIAPGIEEVFDLYSSRPDTYDVFPIVAWSTITTEVDNERPSVLSTGDITYNPPFDFEYTGHSVTVVGYEFDTEDPDYKMVWVHTTWDSPRTAVIEFASWQSAWFTRVVP